MSFNPNQEKNNLKAIIIGLFLIILAVLAIFFRPNFFSKKNKNAELPAQNETKKENLYNFPSISCADLLKKIEGKEDLEIIDLRNPADFEMEHILNSKNISLSDLAQNISALDKNKQYFIVDDLGFSPAEIEMMQFFQKNEFKKVSYLEGGIVQWKNEYNATISVGNPNSPVDQSKVIYLGIDELSSAIEAKKSNLYILDLRSANEYATGHIAGAQNIPLGFLETRYSEIPRGKKIILYSNDGLPAFQGAVKLFDIGILNVYALSDGLNAWKQKGLEVVK